MPGAVILERKVRKVGDSLVVGIPSHVAEFHDISDGSFITFEPMKKGVFRLVANTCRVRHKKTGIESLIPLDETGRCSVPEDFEEIT